jgi:hypothetical protein
MPRNCYVRGLVSHGPCCTNRHAHVTVFPRFRSGCPAHRLLNGTKDLVPHAEHAAIYEARELPNVPPVPLSA